MSSNNEYEHQTFHKMKDKEAAINALIQHADKSKISDGHHTFEDLYRHRNLLFMNLCKMLKERDKTLEIWRSIKQYDGGMDKDFFIMGINKSKDCQITYHFPISMWGQTMWAETLDKAPPWDGHTSEDVLTRLNILI